MNTQFPSFPDSVANCDFCKLKTDLTLSSILLFMLPSLVHWIYTWHLSILSDTRWTQFYPLNKTYKSFKIPSLLIWEWFCPDEEGLIQYDSSQSLKYHLASVKLVVRSMAQLPWNHVCACESTLTHTVGGPAASVYTHDAHTCQNETWVIYSIQKF